MESVNIANPNKGGTAIICLDPSINFKLSDVDTLHNVTWATQMSQIKRDAIEGDSIYGKWVVASFEWNELEINIASIYAPTCVSKPGVTGISSHIAREAFWNFLAHKWTHHKNLIVGGDTNNLPDPLFDRRILIPGTAHPPYEDMAPYHHFLNNNRIIMI